MPSQAELVNRVKQRVISSTALSDGLGRPEGEVEYVSAEAVEVLALLVALIWLSAWTGFWLHSSRAGCHQPDRVSRPDGQSVPQAPREQPVQQQSTAVSPLLNAVQRGPPILSAPERRLARSTPSLCKQGVSFGRG
jgi:hypothetical protein